MKTLEFKIRKAQVHSSETEKKRLEKAQPSRVYVSEEALIELTGSKDGGRPVVIEKCAVGEQPDEPVDSSTAVSRQATLWKAPQRIDKGVTQMYDAFCEACGYRLGDLVRITALPAGTKVPDADEIVLEDVTGTASGQFLPEDDISHWEFFLAGRLQMRVGPPQAEAIHILPGLHLRDTILDGSPRSFRVSTVNQSPSSNGLYVHKKTIVKLRRAVASEPANDGPQKMLQVSGVRGLDPQIKELNRLLACFNKPVGRMPRGVVIHGGRGTGKTMILEHLAKSDWGLVHRIQFTDKLSQVQEIIQKAMSQRPSLLLLDQFERLIDKDRPSRQSVIQSICKAFDDLTAEAETKNEAPRVAIIATCLDYGLDVPEDLRRPGRFAFDISLPTPDVDNRREILASFGVRVREDIADTFLQQLSERTHAYNGTDLKKLVNRARLNCETRMDEATRELESEGSELVEIPEDYEEAFKAVRPTAMHDVNLKPPPIRWHDIGGQDSVKQTLHRAAVLFTMAKGTLHIYKNGPPKGVLLYGPPGCSKTMTAQAMATESGLNFFAVKGAELLNMYVGESERALRTLFKRAREAMPSIIFFDEIDSIAGARAGFGGGGTSSTSHGGLNVLTTLLNEMDGFENMEGVLVLAATNRPQTLDPALLRPGRFDELVYVQPPDEAARRAIFAGVVAKRAGAMSGIDVDSLARQTEGFSGAEVKAVCEKAGDVAVQRYIDAGQPADWKHEVTMSDLEGAIRMQERQITPEMLQGYVKWAAQFRSR